MKKQRLDGGELFGIILITCLAIDLIVGLWIRSEILRIPFLWGNKWVAGLSIAVGIVLLAAGCAGGYISHEAFNHAAGSDGKPKHILTTGLFRLVRHPFYLSLLMNLLAFALILRSFLLLAGWVALGVILVAEARREEKQLLEIFGEQYASYRRKTGMLLPKYFMR